MYLSNARRVGATATDGTKEYKKKKKYIYIYICVCTIYIELIPQNLMVYVVVWVYRTLDEQPWE